MGRGPDLLEPSAASVCTSAVLWKGCERKTARVRMGAYSDGAARSSSRGPDGPVGSCLTSVARTEGLFHFISMAMRADLVRGCHRMASHPWLAGRGWLPHHGHPIFHLCLSVSLLCRPLLFFRFPIHPPWSSHEHPASVDPAALPAGAIWRSRRKSMNRTCPWTSTRQAAAASSTRSSTGSQRSPC